MANFSTVSSDQNQNDAMVAMGPGIYPNKMKIKIGRTFASS